MDTPTRAANAGLVALALVAAGSTGYAIWSVRQPPAETGAAVAGGSSLASLTTDPASGTATSAQPDQAAATTGAPDEDDGGDATPVSVQAWVEALESGEEADLLVVGDGYSNLPGQWVELWAERLGTEQERPVQFRHWGESEDVAFNEALSLTDGDGPTLSVWSASRADTTVADAASRLPDFVAAATEPDAVLITLGRSSEGEDLPDALDDLAGELPDVPVVLVIGPADLYPDGVGDALEDWGADHPDQVAVVDLRDIAPESPSAEEWAQAFDEALRG